MSKIGTSPNSDWQVRKEIKTLIRFAERHSLRETLIYYSLSRHGREIWNLNQEQVSDADRTIKTMAGYMHSKIDKRSLN